MSTFGAQHPLKMPFLTKIDTKSHGLSPLLALTPPNLQGGCSPAWQIARAHLIESVKSGKSPTDRFTDFCFKKIPKKVIGHIVKIT